MKEPEIQSSTAPVSVFLLGISLAVACPAGCDTGGISIPEITVFAPGSSLPVDTLIIGEPFDVMAEVSSRRLEAVEIEVAYGQSADPILSVRIDRFAETTPLVIDTTLALPILGPVKLLLHPEAGTLGEVTVTAEEARSALAEGAPASTIDVTALPIEEIPVLLGEPDLIRIVQRLPGVKTESDFSGRFYVRGGRADQNLVLLDGAPVYSPWHLFGLFSAFNSEALERVELAKGVLPPQYGGRLSSLLDVELEDGSDREGAGHLNVSVLSSTASYGRPISDRTSVLLAARRALFSIATQTSKGSCVVRSWKRRAESRQITPWGMRRATSTRVWCSVTSASART